MYHLPCSGAVRNNELKHMRHCVHRAGPIDRGHCGVLRSSMHCAHLGDHIVAHAEPGCGPFSLIRGFRKVAYMGSKLSLGVCMWCQKLEGNMKAGGRHPREGFCGVWAEPCACRGCQICPPEASAILVQSVVNHKDETEQLCFSMLWPGCLR